MSDPYGIIDLASLRDKPKDSDTVASPYEVAVTENTLQQIVQDSTKVATLLLVTSLKAPQLSEYLAILRKGVTAKGGALRLAIVDVEAQPGVAQALQVHGIPALMVLLGGQLQPVAEGVVPENDLSGLFDQLIQVAQQQGLDVSGAATSGTSEPEPEPLPPLLKKAYDAIEADDLDGAVQSFDEYLTQHPADAQAKAGRSTALLMRRTRSADLHHARHAAAEDPHDLDAQMLVADLDMIGGHVDDAFGRLLDLLRGADAETKDRIRQRLLELFDVAGVEDPRVGAARRRMANLLF